MQVRYYVRSMNGGFRLPSSEEMTRHWQSEMAERAARGYTRRQAHMMGPDQVRRTLLVSGGGWTLTDDYTHSHRSPHRGFIMQLFYEYLEVSP